MKYGIAIPSLREQHKRIEERIDEAIEQLFKNNYDEGKTDCLDGYVIFPNKKPPIAYYHYTAEQAAATARLILDTAEPDADPTMLLEVLRKIFDDTENINLSFDAASRLQDATKCNFIGASRAIYRKQKEKEQPDEGQAETEPTTQKPRPKKKKSYQPRQAKEQQE